MTTAAIDQESNRSAAVLWGVLAACMVLPSLLSWLEFVALARGDGQANGVQQIALAAGKLLQFSLPVVCFCLLERRWPWPGLPNLRGLKRGLAFGLVVAGAMLALYVGFLRGTPVFVTTADMVRHKLAEFNLDSRLAFILFAAALCVVHSLLEEYYWRWFVFGWLRKLMPPVGAMLLSSVAFMGHHVIILGIYFPGNFWTAALPFSLCVAGGGFIWAWLYHQTGSIWAPWLSHLIIDSAIMIVGYDLVFGW